MIFDIEQFYPSIKESVLLKALDFAKKHTKVLKKDIDVIRHSRRSLLFNQGETWVKKEDEKFDVTMGAYDGAEVCELVGIYLQFLIGECYNKEEFGLYRDDGLAALRNISGPESERIRKKFIKIFKENHFNLEIRCNLKIVDYLDVTFNLNDGSYRPYHKPNDELMYVHQESNHPPAITKQLPLSIQARLRSLSSSKEIFDESVKPYQEALNRSGYKHILKYEDEPAVKKRRRGNRQRDIIWFNPPYSKSVKTNVGKYFLKLLEKHFPKRHKMSKIFNRNTVKISYSCMPSMKAVTNRHNKKVLKKQNENQEPVRTCNCKNPEECPFDGICLERDVQYVAEVKSDLPNYGVKVYKGITSTEWKTRYGNHKKAFNSDQYETDSALSKEVWRIKRLRGEYTIKWSKEESHPSYKPEIKVCSLCQNEKLKIATYSEKNLLNQRNEIISRCRHRLKFKLAKLIF